VFCIWLVEQQAGNAGDQSQNIASTLIGDQVVVRSQGTVTLAGTQAAATGEDGTLLVLAQDIKDKEARPAKITKPNDNNHC
jgi:hypothetical protein